MAKAEPATPEAVAERHTAPTLDHPIAPLVVAANTMFYYLSMV
jgi:hypothetical protein